MSEPTPPKPQPHHKGYKSYTSTWRDSRGRAHTKRFGRVGKVSSSKAVSDWRRWMAGEYPKLRKADDAAYSVAALCDEYFATEVETRYVSQGKPTTSVNKHRIAFDSFKALYGHQEAADMTAGKVAAWLERHLTERLSGPEDVAKTRGTVNTSLSYVKRMYRWASKYEKVPDATAGAVQIVEGIRSDHATVRHTDPKAPVAWEVVQKTVAKCGDALADMVLLQWHTGMRPGEVTTIRATELTERDGVTLYQPRHHKTAWRRKTRVIVLGPKSRAIVARHVTTTPAEPMFRRPNGKPYTTQQYREAIEVACRAAKVGRWNPNQIRHSYATRVAEQFGELAVQDMLGHANLNQQRVYVEKSVRRAIEVAKAVG